MFYLSLLSSFMSLLPSLLPESVISTIDLHHFCFVFILVRFPTLFRLCHSLFIRSSLVLVSIYTFRLRFVSVSTSCSVRLYPSVR